MVTPTPRSSGWCRPALLLLLLSAASVAAAGGPDRSRGERVYVAVYSHVLFGDHAAPFNLAATLSIRNTDPNQTIRVEAADYHDGGGRLVKRYIDRPRALAPLAATEVFVPESDTSGGLGASFLVRWTSAAPATAPVVECLLIGARSGQGISIVSPGRVIDRTPP
jgi:hypothetical protein